MPIATLVQTKRNFMRITETIAAILANETASHAPAPASTRLAVRYRT